MFNQAFAKLASVKLVPPKSLYLIFFSETKRFWSLLLVYLICKSLIEYFAYFKNVAVFEKVHFAKGSYLEAFITCNRVLGKNGKNKTKEKKAKKNKKRKKRGKNEYRE